MRIDQPNGGSQVRKPTNPETPARGAPQPKSPPASAAPRIAGDSLAPSGTGVSSGPNASTIARSYSADWKSHEVHLTAEQRARLPELAARVNATQVKTFEADRSGNKEHYAEVKKTEGTEAAQKLLLRGEHQKGLYGTADAKVRVADDLPPELEGGPFQKGQTLRAVVRFSHGPASDNISDEKAAHPGVAIRITDDKGHTQDLLLSTGASGFVAKDGFAAVAALEAQAEGAKHGKAAAALTLEKQLVKERGLFHGGSQEAVRMIHDAGQQDVAGVSLADRTFFSKVPFQLGDRAVKFRLVPKQGPSDAKTVKGFDGMRTELRDRLKKGPVTYELQVQGYIDPKRTPMNDARAVWDSPYVTVAELELPQATTDRKLDAGLKGVNDLSFSPFNRWDANDDRAMKPIGPVNEVREEVYKSSQKFRGADGAQKKGCPYGFG